MIKERIKQYAEYKCITISKLEQDTGIPNGIIGKNGNINVKTLAKVLNKYEDINPFWLILNKGEMLRRQEEETYNMMVSEPKAEYNVGKNAMGNISGENDIDIKGDVNINKKNPDNQGNFKEIFDFLKSQIEEKDRQINHLMDILHNSQKPSE